MSEKKEATDLKIDDLSPDFSTFDPGAYLNGEVENPIQDQLESGNFSVLSSSDLVLTGPGYFNNYELSWLDFNFRVLDEARKQENPPLERAQFIGIVCSNLDEFVQKRVGGLKRQLEAGMNTPSVDGLTPLEQLRAIRKKVKRMIEDYRSVFFDEIVPALSDEKIYFKSYSELTKKERKKADDYFQKQLFPILTPLIVDQGHPFPFISNKSRSLAVEVMDSKSGEHIFARIKIPNNRPRWFKIELSESVVLVNIDDIIHQHIGTLFMGAQVQSSHIFRVTRNADIKRSEEEADDLLELIEDELRERRFAEVVRLEIDARMPDHVRELLKEQMNVQDLDIFEMNGPIGLADCSQLSKLLNRPDLRFKPWSPVLHPSFRALKEDSASDIFSVIRKGDILVHHPYYSFAGSVERFVKEAAADPKVLAIKQTLYRTSPDSSLMHALINAVDAGKQVAVLVELKARFDEQQNIEWAVKLEKAGVHVSYGLPGLKIHSKITVVVRDEGDTLRRYAHIGTGNYHPGTANLYEDLGLFTCEDDITSDVSDLFNFLTGYAPDQTYKQLLVAPYYLRSAIKSLIDFEVDQAASGKDSRIIMKMNSLEDPELIQRLYYASSQGVSIDLIVRGVCRLKTGIPGLSENIRVHSVIGRFLEHSRVYYFRHGGEHRYYIGSADIMHRNLDARVEAITPILNINLKKYLRFILNVYLRDNRQRWVLQPDSTYTRATAPEDEPAISTHQLLMNHTSGNHDPIPMEQ
ncbi:MAG: polyphosphate kinase 1 [Balneolales bacterium]|nr:polyphosphate kinase 1 [Balneolales bacterium]